MKYTHEKDDRLYLKQRIMSEVRNIADSSKDITSFIEEVKSKIGINVEGKWVDGKIKITYYIEEIIDILNHQNQSIFLSACKSV